MLWNNKNRLINMDTKLDKEGNLIFKTEQETVMVELNDKGIKRVIVEKRDKNKIVIENSTHVVVGKDNYERDVYHYLTPNGPTKQLRLGITKHRGEGTWSSLPHKFEMNLEKNFEEVFFYILSGSTQRAVQIGIGMWPNGEEVKDVWMVSDRTFSSIPMGYHPVVGEVGVHVSYVWAYLAKHKRWEKI